MKGVHLAAQVPEPLPAGARRLVLYATPNGNTIEQTLGCATAPGRDWHFDTQHVAAQVRPCGDALVAGGAPIIADAAIIAARTIRSSGIAS